MQKYRVSAIVSVITVILIGSSLSAWASFIDPGFDLFATTSGTFVDLGGPIGIVPLEGNPDGLSTLPNNLGNTDTIVERKQGIDPLIPPSGSGTIDIELVALSLRSINPINIGGTDFDMEVISGRLLIGAPDNSDGSMDILHSDDDGGLFNATLPVDSLAIFTEVGNASNTFTQPIPTKTFITTNAEWSHNGFENPNFPSGGFFPKGLIEENADDAKHVVRPAQIPRDVGGELLPIDTTALLVAGVQTPMAWMMYAFSAIGIGAFLFTRNPNNIRNVKVILQDYLDRF